MYMLDLCVCVKCICIYLFVCVCMFLCTGVFAGAKFFGIRIIQLALAGAATECNIKAHTHKRAFIHTHTYKVNIYM